MKISIIGGGSAGLFAAALLSQEHQITLYEKGKRIGRKFLVAGNGGFNLTNAAQGESLAHAYRPQGFLDQALLEFDTHVFRNQLADWGIPTFVGSSGRVFPKKGIKPVEVLQSILNILQKNQVDIQYFHEFIGFNTQQKPVLLHNEKQITPTSDVYIFALGGASWSKTGSDGKWCSYFNDIDIQTKEFEASNCGFNIKWKIDFIQKYEGTPLKNIAISIGESLQKGEALITEYGLEGNAVYPLTHEVRNIQSKGKKAIIFLNLKPHSPLASLHKRALHLQAKNYKYAFKLSPVKLALLKEFTDKETYLNATLLADKLQHLPIPIESIRPMEEAISTVGGIDLQEVNADFSLKKYPHIYTIGEMLNWDTATGGFLLQGCFSMAAMLAKKGVLNKK